MTKNQQLVRYMTNVFIVRFTQRWKKLMTLSKMNCPSLARACPPFVSMSIILPIIDLPPLKAERHNIIVQSKNNQQENNFFVIWSSYATFAFQYINTLYIFYHIAYVCIVFKGLMFHEKDNITTLWDPMDSSQPSSSVHGIFQARILEWVAISFSRGSSQPTDRTQVFRIVGRRFTVWATREGLCFMKKIT